MHPHTAHELARIRMADLLADAERELLVRSARPHGPRPIDAVGLRERLTRLLTGRGGPAGTGQPRTAEA
jgi:hypothetical protein